MLQDLTSLKYLKDNKNTEKKKILQLDYGTNFIYDKSTAKLLQPSKCLRLSSLNKNKKRKRERETAFNSRLIKYIKKLTRNNLIQNIKFTEKIGLDENSYWEDWLRSFLSDIHQKGNVQAFSKNNGANTQILKQS